MCNNKLITPPCKQTNVNKERYGALDGLRAYAALGILLMHVQANIKVKPSVNYLTRELIPFFTDFTLLFMIVSGFSLCCGYYQRMKEGAITPADFYKKRYARILPFFAILCLLDLALSPSWGAVCDVYSNLTLCFGLLPSDVKINVIGVGWFLGVVFLFYMLFPFFVFLLDNKRRAWFSFVAALVFVLVGLVHFDPIDRKNMVFCAPLFMAGGLAYLYRGQIAAFTKRNFLWSCVAVMILTVCYFVFRHDISTKFLSYTAELTLFALWLVYAIGSRDIVLNNKIVKYLSGISMEIYLAHMVVFRVVEKVHLENYISQNDVLYIVTSLLTIIGVICFAHVMKYNVLKPVVKWIGG